MKVAEPKSPMGCRSRVGFTLLELMVATAIAVIVVAMIIQIVAAMLGHANRAMSNLDRDLSMESALIRIEEDLQGLVWLDGALGMMSLKLPDQGWQMEGWNAVPVDTKPAVISISDFALNNDSMNEERWGKFGATASWLTVASNQGFEDPGGVYAVSYQLKRITSTFGGFPRYALMRSEVSARNTFAVGFDVQSGGYSSGGFDSSALWSPSIMRHPNANHVLLENVIDFGIRAYQRDRNSGIWSQIFPNPERNASIKQKPDLVVVMLRVLSEVGAERIENIEQGRIHEDWWKSAQGNSQIVTRSVIIP
ncbi:MAG: prepilin-type N-terminal cleavage/methylation domain-containing protein [Opitutales bacterium]|nr:prepilin-type N-terminal cleavage/methylation domain-containing protein [Opitutales bacterium]